MLKKAPDVLILQTHSSMIMEDLELIVALSKQCTLRGHLTIEGDKDSLPGLPPPPCSVEKRISIAKELVSMGITVVICMSPLYPLFDPS